MKARVTLFALKNLVGDILLEETSGRLGQCGHGLKFDTVSEAVKGRMKMLMEFCLA